MQGGIAVIDLRWVRKRVKGSDNIARSGDCESSHGVKKLLSLGS